MPRTVDELNTICTRVAEAVDELGGKVRRLHAVPRIQQLSVVVDFDIIQVCRHCATGRVTASITSTQRSPHSRGSMRCGGECGQWEINDIRRPYTRFIPLAVVLSVG